MREVRGRVGVAIAVWAATATLFHLWTAGFGFFEPRTQRSFHLMFLLPLAFLLYPADPKQRARTLFFEEYADTRLVEILGTVFFQRFVQVNLMKKPADEALVREAIDKKLPPTMDYLEDALGDRPFMVGEHFTVADIALTSPFVNFMIAGEKLDAKRWPRYAAYLERIHARPAYKPIVEGDLGR